MSMLLISFIIYIVSFFLVRYEYRLCSSKHCGILPNRECQLDWTWYIPIGNTICVFALFVLLLSNISLLKIKYKPKWKIFNWDLPD